MKHDALLDLLLRIYECPDVMFVIESEQPDLAKEIEEIIEENFE
jgi:hypothetical protein